eukprot:CAMPEP_0205822480 /NCGR_PEP_ID=MMETSP0206-20130828/12672_1 /ASSEMBLY_ACC=CAM_ASM_000279 /TAXON_ID=36767 /ORGANISM="Euplotes focardii, Strain TN1" /LENGTH=73 /DNA_ID=CAMNT_0053118781 /DNA_START=60 /DNA_END=281 /DNA_ORIENTATION=+
MFEDIDTSGDRRISKKEFARAAGLVESWGVTVDDPDATFHSIDTNGGGKILFDEFSHWALHEHLKLDPCAGDL